MTTKLQTGVLALELSLSAANSALKLGTLETEDPLTEEQTAELERLCALTDYFSASTDAVKEEVFLNLLAMLTHATDPDTAGYATQDVLACWGAQSFLELADDHDLEIPAEDRARLESFLEPPTGYPTDPSTDPDVQRRLDAVFQRQANGATFAEAVDATLTREEIGG